MLSGATTNVEAGQTVTISLNGRIIPPPWTTAATGLTPCRQRIWLVHLKDGDASVQVSVTSVNGKRLGGPWRYSVDATAPSVTINTIATDDILNASEAQSDLAISGTTTAEAGRR